MVHNLEELLRKLEVDTETEDLHITRNLSSFIAISEGEVIGVTDPKMSYCPLVDLLSGGMKEEVSIEELKNRIKRGVEEKISKFGYFTNGREIVRDDIAVPFGASEMILYAMRRGLVDAAILVCDGAGSVVVDRPQVVQGIGARMNGIFYTSPLEGVIEKLKKEGCYVVSPETADINQVEGVKLAADLGYRNIVVAVNGYLGGDLHDFGKVEKEKDVTVYVLVVCTTGAENERVEEFKEFADLVWSCASEGVRNRVGRNSILQIATAIPVFVLTEMGLHFVSAYSDNGDVIANLNPSKQYIISKRFEGREVRLGNMDTYLSEKVLPVRVEKEPRPLL